MSSTGSEAAPRSAARQLGTHALIYLVSGLLVRGLSFLLTPLYTRVMTPEDFGVVAVANTVGSALSLALGFGLHGCIPRLYVESPTEEGRRRLLGTLTTFVLIAPAVITALIYGAGMAGLLDRFATVRFQPHLQLVILGSLLGVFLPLPTTVYLTREQPMKVAALNGVTTAAQLVCVLLFVLVLQQGALGVLRGNLAANAVTGAVGIALMLRIARPAFARADLRRALAFSLPLVPHLIANWVLAISDRLILDRYVAAGDVGRYSLAYMFAVIVSLVASSITSPLGPMFNRQLQDPAQAAHVPRLGTYAMVGIVACALPVAMFAPEAIRLLAQPSYAGAAVFVPWVVLGSVFQGVYFICSTGTWFSMRTGAVPLVTIAGAAVNIGLNLWLVPRYGAMAAAVTTAVGYMLTALAHAALAHHLHPIAWPYGRWLGLIAAAVVTYAAGTLGASASLSLAIARKTLALLVIFPLGLALGGFVKRADLLLVWERVRGSLARAG